MRSLATWALTRWPITTGVVVFWLVFVAVEYPGAHRCCHARKPRSRKCRTVRTPGSVSCKSTWKATGIISSGWPANGRPVT